MTQRGCFRTERLNYLCVDKDFYIYVCTEPAGNKRRVHVDTSHMSTIRAPLCVFEDSDTRNDVVGNRKQLFVADSFLLTKDC